PEFRHPAVDAEPAEALERSMLHVDAELLALGTALMPELAGRERGSRNGRLGCRTDRERGRQHGILAAQADTVESRGGHVAELPEIVKRFGGLRLVHWKSAILRS